MYEGEQDYDNLVWDKNDDDWDESYSHMRLETTCRDVEALASRLLNKPATVLSPILVGGYNVLYRIRLEGSDEDVLVRLPGPNLVPFPDEKTSHEAATLRYVAKNTKLPIAGNLFDGNDPKLGPFIILKYIENYPSLSARTTAPKANLDETHTLNPNIVESTLEELWTRVATCLLQLSELTLPKIGSLVERDGLPDVLGRPITHNMTDMIRLANIPQGVLPPEGETFETADAWYSSLADMHLAQLVFQHNDAVTDEDDCRNKYVARQIFRRLAAQGKLSTFGFAEDKWSAQSSKQPSSSLAPAPAGNHSFRLWGDDFRAGNVLLNESDDLAAVIDWEFTYAAPAQFILDPPWWLLLDTPETWEPNIDDWTETYDRRLETWLSAMKRAEGSREHDSLPAPLSTYMRESWETGRFWLSYAALRSWAFDLVYWKYLDERFFGEREKGVSVNELWKTRAHLLSVGQRMEMEPLVRRKMEESAERKIVDWPDAEAKEQLSRWLCD